ncbi:hypothetical protein B0I26_102277 [Anoxybacillus vitaminiphilus]|uniref:YkoP-like domain-containing protein n=2 Tax=Paranoxybacillus vitaminiphilus TaxID=581036 RepID=A0A327YRE1_9BACL|nr:hypothetical protein B0I26_102277 [Anoxybacillus vitaminiphilus]
MVKMRQCFLTIWSALDPIYYFCSRLEYVEDQTKNRDIFRVRLTKYKGRNIVLSDGTEIIKNDLLLKIHLHNVRLIKELIRLDNEIKKGRHIYEQVKRGLPNLTEYLQRHEQFADIKGIIGITILNKGCERLGFETFSIMNPFYKWYKQTAFAPMYLISRFRLDSFRKPPKYLFMSKDKLLKLYGCQSDQ